MHKSCQEQKRLDEGLNLIFRSKNRQIMLSRIHEFRQFAGFYLGHEPVQVITSSKATFLASLQATDTSNKQFLLSPIGERPPLQPGESLLLLFHAGRNTALAQATVSGIFGSNIRVNAVDPRKNIRYKTRMRVLWNLLTAECFERFSRKEITVSRDIQIPESLFKPPDQNHYLVRDTVCELDGTACVYDTIFCFPAPQLGLMVDISVGGFCLMLPDAETVTGAHDNLFFSVQVPMPHIQHDFSMQLISVVRHIRKMDEGAMVHCMLIERLDPDVFNL